MLNVQAKNLGSVAVLSLQGQLVYGETKSLRDAVEALRLVSALKLDLARVDVIDARGLGAMLELREQAKASGVRFELMNVTRRIQRLLELTRLDSGFQITSAVEFFPAAARRQKSQLAPFASLRSCA